MSDTPRIYRSTDPGAPQLTGQAGSFAALMDAVLVDGYGSGLDAKAGLGWTRAFTGLNKRVFRNDPAHYTGCYMRFDDANAQYVLVDAYESMTTVDVGVARFSSSSNAWGKSSASSSTSRAWIVVGTARCVYVLSQPVGSGNWQAHFFGDTHPLTVGDAWAFMYTRSDSANAFSNSSSLGTNSRNLQAQRTVVGVSGDALCRVQATLFANSSTWGNSGFPYPFHGHGGALLSRGFVREGDAGGTASRAYLPGLWVPEHNLLTLHAIGEVVTTLLDGHSLLATSTLGSITNSRVYLDLTSDWVAP